jgi:hypothetical protein
MHGMAAFRGEIHLVCTSFIIIGVDGLNDLIVSSAAVQGEQRLTEHPQRLPNHPSGVIFHNC